MAHLLLLKNLTNESNASCLMKPIASKWFCLTRN